MKGTKISNHCPYPAVSHTVALFPVCYLMSCSLEHRKYSLGECRPTQDARRLLRVATVFPSCQAGSKRSPVLKTTRYKAIPTPVPSMLVTGPGGRWRLPSQVAHFVVLSAWGRNGHHALPWDTSSTDPVPLEISPGP